jgi:hypothetical protein
MKNKTKKQVGKIDSDNKKLLLSDVSKRSELLSDFENWLDTKTYDDLWTKHLINEYRKSLNCC